MDEGEHVKRCAFFVTQTKFKYYVWWFVGNEERANCWCNSKDPSRIKKLKKRPRLLKLIYLMRVQDKWEDILVWCEDRNGNPMKSYYNSLCVETIMDFLAKEIWSFRAQGSKNWPSLVRLGQIVFASMLAATSPILDTIYT